MSIGPIIRDNKYDIIHITAETTKKSITYAIILLEKTLAILSP